MWSDEVLGFWFGLRKEQWWKPDPQLDAQVRERFLDLWQARRGQPADDFLADPKTALAAVILFDQLPRNMFRGTADSFASDALALAISRAAIDRGFDRDMQPQQRGFLYMPFQHSEELDIQNRSIELFTALGDEEQLTFAVKHREVIERFGRFPHRNSVLGREPQPAEIGATDIDPTKL